MAADKNIRVLERHLNHYRIVKLKEREKEREKEQEKKQEKKQEQEKLKEQEQNQDNPNISDIQKIYKFLKEEDKEMNSKYINNNSNLNDYGNTDAEYKTESNTKSNTESNTKSNKDMPHKSFEPHKTLKPLNVEWFRSECKLNKYTLGLSFYQGGILFIKYTSDPEIIRVMGYADYEPNMSRFDIARRAVMPESKAIEFDDIIMIKPSIEVNSDSEMDYAEAKSITMNRAFRTSIRVWLETTDFNSFSKAIKQRVKGQEQLDRVLINVYSYMENMAEGRPHNNNILVAAPSGCGKTETFRAIRDYFAKALPAMPIYQVDMTSITEEGFKGKDTKAVVAELETDKGTDGIGIVFLDEFDKKLLPSHDSKGNNINKAVQSQLLTTFEGVKYPDLNVDTNNTLFIALGAFDTCRESKSVEVKHIGFGAENEGGEDHYSAITRKDIIDLGASYELLGRFGTIVNYHKLSDEVVDRIINGMAKEIGQSIGAYVKIHDDFRKELRENANSKFGCRLLKSMINDSAMEAYLEIQRTGKNHRKSQKRMTIELQGENKYRLG